MVYCIRFLEDLLLVYLNYKLETEKRKKKVIKSTYITLFGKQGNNGILYTFSRGNSWSV